MLLNLISNPLLSQTPPYYHYTPDDGLPSATTYDIIQDKEGYIWIATNNGISRFDGINFKNFGIQDGLNSSTIVSLAEDENGNIFIGNYEEGINIFKEGKIIKFKKDKINIWLEGIKSVHLNSFRIGDIFLNDGKLYLEGNGFLVLEKDSVQFFSPKSMGKSSQGEWREINRAIKISNGNFLAATNEGIYEFQNNIFIKLTIKGLPDSEFYHAAEDKEGNLYTGCNGNIYVIKNNSVIKTYKVGEEQDKVFKIMVDSKGNIWYTLMNKGISVIYEKTGEIFDLSKKLKIPKASINKLFEDKEGNIWISTFGKGIFCLNNLYLTNYNEDDGLTNNNVQAFTKDGFNRIIIGTYNGINILNNYKFENIEFRGFITNYIYELNYTNNKIYVCTQTKSKIIEKSFYDNGFVFFTGISFCFTRDKKYYIGCWGNDFYFDSNFYKIVPNKNFYSLYGNDFINNRINKIFEDSKNHLWFGTGLGVVRMTGGEKSYFKEDPVMNSQIKSIDEDKQGNVWFAGDAGIANYNYETSEIKSFTKMNGYDFSASTSIAFDKDNRVWIGNMKGLFMFHGDSVNFFNTKTGLPSNEILSLFYYKERNILYVGTSYGFSEFDIDYFDNYKPLSLNVNINEIKSGDSIYTLNNEYVFEPKNNNIFIGFTALNFSSPNTLMYQYKLNEEWINLDNNFLDFSSMSEGIYNLALRAKIQNSEWSEPVFLTFTVKPKFVETIWFQLIILVLISGVILWAARYRIRLNKKKNIQQMELTKRMNDLKHQALSAMMNPHFIFNSLNSVQYLVNKDRKDEANDYIAMMGKLIRKNLDIAGNSFISLKEEISRLKLYLEIEQLRFQDKFAYEIDINKDVDMDSIMIPNMIIQPFVENAVWHGIMNLNRNGFVSVSFGFENIDIDSNLCKCFVIKIKDNGIGYNKSHENKKEGHISKGIKIIEERLRILSDDFNLPEPVIIEDLSQRSESSSGTEVIISLPPNLYKFEVYSEL